jgi:hypothetical protein
MKEHFKEHGIKYLALVCYVAMLYALVVSKDRRDEKETSKAFQYVKEHRCIRTGFVGKYATAAYKCNNGLWTFDEIKQLANGETLIWQPSSSN